MSFSSDCKQELCALRPEKSCCRVSELCALYMALGSLNLLGRGKTSVQFVSESIAVSRRVYTLLTQEMRIAPQIHYVTTARFGGSRKCVLTLGPLQSPAFLQAFGMTSADENGVESLRTTTPKISLTRACCTRAFLRGAMLGGGTVTHPDRGYHLELHYRDEAMGERVAKCLQRLNLPCKRGKRGERGFFYLKQSDQIVTLLTAMGAHQAVMQTEDLRVKRQVLETVNRAMNCDSANLEKQMNASDEQITVITRLLQSGELAKLPKALQEIAIARLQAPDATLAELGEQLTPPLGKSGVNHRMRRLMEYKET